MNTPGREGDSAATPWRRIMIWIGILLAVVVVLDVYLTLRYMRAPRAPAPRAAATAAAPAIAPAAAPRAVLPPAPPVTAAPAVVPAPATAPTEVDRHRLDDQAESLRMERRERSNDGSLLTPPEEEADRLTREGREIY